jgi:hypothetical protein
MHTVPLRLTGLVLVLGCQGAADDPQPSGPGGYNSGGATSGSGAVAQPTGGTTPTVGSGTGGAGGSAGSVSSDGGVSAQAAGGGAGGRSSGAGSSGRGGNGTSGGGGSANGDGGTGSCVKNLGCKLAAPASTGDIYQDCVDRINQFLTQCACLPALTRSTQGEACANQMAEYDAGKNSAHAGAIDQICEPSGSQNECPGYSSNNQVISLCFQQMWDEGPPPAGSCTGDCYEQHGHFINMTDKSVTKVACGFYTTSSGKVWAAQNFFR